MFSRLLDENKEQGHASGFAEHALLGYAYPSAPTGIPIN